MFAAPTPAAPAAPATPSGAELLDPQEGRDAAGKAGAVGRRGSRRCSSGAEWIDLAVQVGTMWAAANPAAAAAMASANVSGVRRPATVDSHRDARRDSRRTPAQPPRPSRSAGQCNRGLSGTHASVPLSPASRAASHVLQLNESGRELLLQALLCRAAASTAHGYSHCYTQLQLALYMIAGAARGGQRARGRTRGARPASGGDWPLAVARPPTDQRGGRRAAHTLASGPWPQRDISISGDLDARHVDAFAPAAANRRRSHPA